MLIYYYKILKISYRKLFRLLWQPKEIKISVQVITSDFENSYGKKPKGFGNWAFWMGRDILDIGKAHFFRGNYGDVLKQARARELGVDTITLGT